VGTIRVEGICLHDEKSFAFIISIGMLRMSKGQTNWTFQLGQSNKKLIQNFGGKDSGGGYWQIKTDKGMLLA
jgi:hypothetical protein